MKLMKVGRDQHTPTRSSRPPKQQAQIVNLTAPLPNTTITATTATATKSKSQKLDWKKSNASQEKKLASTPGLVIHMPDPMKRNVSPQSQQSALQQEQQQQALQQLQKLRIDLLGERKETIIATTARKGILMGDDAVRDEPPVPSPSPSHYSTMYSGAGAILKSPMSCLSTDQMLSTVDDANVASKGIGNHGEAEPKEPPSNDPPNRECIELETRQTSYVSQMTMSTIQRQPQGVPKKNPLTKIRTRGSPPARPINVPWESEFDMQKSLEGQLAKLPGSRPPGTSAKSFDDHSYIISSGTKTLDSMSKSGSQQRGSAMEHMSVVSIVPCDSYTPMGNAVGGQSNDSKLTDTVVDIRKKYSQSKRNKLKRAPPEQRAETVKIDNGLMCVLPNNLNPKMQEILQQQLQQQKNSNSNKGSEAEQARGPRQQVGMIVEAKDLMDMTRSKRKTKAKAKNNDKTSISIRNKLKDIFQSQKDWTSLSRMSPRRTSQKKSGPFDQQESKTTVSNDDDKWYKQTLAQESYKIKKVVDGKALKGGTVNTGGSYSSSLSSNNSKKDKSIKSERNLEVVTAAEGKSPMFKIPSPHQQEADSRAIELVTSMTERLKQQEQLAILTKEKMNSKRVLGDILKQQSVGSPKITQKPNLRPLPSQITDGGSFCLNGSPSLETLNTYKVNEVVKKFAQEQITAMNGRILPSTGGEDAGKAPSVHNNETTEDPENKPAAEVASLKEKDQRTSTALHDAKVAILFSLKHKIVSEIKKQKQREQEAIARGESISDEDKEKALNEIRRLHMRREQLQRVSESTIQNVFNKHLLATKNEKDQENTVDSTINSGDDGNASDDDSGVNEIEGRKNVTFARTSRDSEDYGIIQSGGGTSSRLPHGGLMSWAQCGIQPSAMGSCGPMSSEKHGEGRNTLAKEAPMRALGAAALKTADKAKAGVQKFKENNVACASPKARANEDYFSDDSHSSCSSAPKGRVQKGKSPRNKSKKDKLEIVMSHSGSLKSERSFETRDTRHTEYTERTYDTGYGSCDSYDSYDYDRRRKPSRSPRKQSRSPRKQSRKPSTPRRAYRRYDSHSVAGTEYTEDTFEDFGCQGGFWEPVAFR